VHSPVIGMRRLAAVAGTIVILAAGAAGCASSGSSAPTPRQSLQLAAQAAESEKSTDATLSFEIAGANSSDNIRLAGTVKEQVHPSLLLEADYSTVSEGSTIVPGGMVEIDTSTAVYAKSSALSGGLGGGTLWIEEPAAQLKQGSSQLFSNLETDSPITQTELLGGATSVRSVGTSKLNGIPVTEYSGTITMAAALSHLPPSLRSQLKPVITQNGITSAQFRIWLDDQHQARKIVLTENTSNSVTEYSTVTVDTINQPVNIQVPPASEVTSFPG
jgi:hypothetical protein